MITTMEKSKGIQGQASQRDLFRLSAVLYAEMTDTFSSQEVLLSIVECVLAELGNTPTAIEDLQAVILEKYKLNITEDELVGIFARHKKGFAKTVDDTRKFYQLTPEKFEVAHSNANKNIDSFITLFIQESTVSNEDGCREAIYYYLYELTTTNINSYKIILSAIESGKEFKESDLSVEADLFTEEQLQYIHAFVEWNNAEKNVALSNIVFCCLEYCLLVAGDRDNALVSKYIQNRVIYLDTNIIFRALGINGASRKNVVMAFLRKCKQAKIDIVVTTYTKKEFFETMEYYIQQINEFPRGEIYLGAYEGLSDYNIYAFYNEWLQDHSTLSLRYFHETIQSAYDLLVKTFDIKNKIGSDVNVFSEDAVRIRHIYENGIAAVKKDLRAEYINTCEPVPQFSHDATLVYITENERHTDDAEAKESNSFLVSSDKALRFWDMQRVGHSYPVVIYPSQLFLMLIKVCGRSEDDMNSFVSFINIRNRSQQISPEKANIILSGISSITADVESQKVLVGSVFDTDFQHIIQNSNTDKELYESIQLYSQRYLEMNLDEAEKARKVAEEERDKAKNKVDEITQTAVQTEESLEKRYAEINAHKEQICQFAEKKTEIKSRFAIYVVPTLLVILFVAFFVFVLLQFVACGASWNFATRFSDYVQITTFGKGSSGPLYLIDFALFCGLTFICQKAMKNPFDRVKGQAYRSELVEKYIKENNLL